MKFKLSPGCLLLPLVLSNPNPVMAELPPGIGLAGDPVDALASALPALFAGLCMAMESTGQAVSFHEALRILQNERKKYPLGIQLTLTFRVRASTTAEGPGGPERITCVLAFEPVGGYLNNTYSGPPLYNPSAGSIAPIHTTGLGPPLPNFPGITSLQITPASQEVKVCDSAKFNQLTATLNIDGVTHRLNVKTTDALWDSSDHAALVWSPIARVSAGGAAFVSADGPAQMFQARKDGNYQVNAYLPAGVSASAKVKVLPVGIEKLKIGPVEMDAYAGESINFMARAYYEDSDCKNSERVDGKARWKVSRGGSFAGNVLTVAQSQEKGVLTVTAEIEDPLTRRPIVSNEAIVNIKPPKIRDIIVVAEPTTIPVCTTTAFSAYVRYENLPNKNITQEALWRFTSSGNIHKESGSSDEAKRIKADWKSTPVDISSGAGSLTGTLDSIVATATLTSSDGVSKQGSSEVTVTGPGESYPYFPAEDVSPWATIKVGESKVNAAYELYCQGEALSQRKSANASWKSANPDLLECEDNGRCTGRKQGETQVEMYFQGSRVTARTVTIEPGELFAKLCEQILEELQGIKKGADEAREKADSASNDIAGAGDWPGAKRALGRAAEAISDAKKRVTEVKQKYTEIPRAPE